MGWKSSYAETNQSCPGRWRNHSESNWNEVSRDAICRTDDELTVQSGQRKCGDVYGQRHHQGHDEHQENASENKNFWGDWRPD